MKTFVALAVAAALSLAVAACGKPAGDNNCKSGDTSCDYTKE